MKTIIELKDYSDVKNGKIYKADNSSEEEATDIDSLCRDIQKIINMNVHSIVNINGENKALNKGLRLFKDFNGSYWTDKYVGVISYKDYQISIGSRFDEGERQYFLQYVFSRAFGNNGSIFEDMKLFGKTDTTWDFLLMILFINQMKTALRKGTFRRYRQFSYNDSKVKGQIDIPRHIRENPLFNGKIAYNTREYTVNNYYNILFLRALDSIEKKYPAEIRNLLAGESELRKAVELLKSSIPEWNAVNTQTILNKTERKIVNSIYKSCEPLRVTSRLLLQRLSINSFSANKSEVSGFVIDMNRLWEVFLHKTLLHNMNYQNEFSILNGKRTIIPDFYHKEKKLVIDAKYKASWGKTLNAEKWGDDVRDDVFQVMAYMLALDCTKGVVLFPCRDESIPPEKYAENYGPLSIFANGIVHKDDRNMFRFPFPIPKYKDVDGFGYNDFKNGMDTNIDKLKNELDRIIL